MLGSTTSSNEGAKLVGTSTKANLNNATTVEVALAHLNTYIGANVSATEFGYLDGVTSNIQTQINAVVAGGGGVTSVTASAPLSSSGGTTPTISFAAQATNSVMCGPASGSPDFPGFRALVAADIPSLDAAKITSGTIAAARLGSGSATASTFLHGNSTWSALAAADMPSAIDATKIGAGAVSNTEFGYLDGVTSAIQTQLDAKAAASHTHAAADIVSGTVATGRLGSGTADSSHYLRGDQTWATVQAVSPTIYTASDGATVTFDLTNSLSQIVTLGGNRTLAVSNDSGNVIFDIQLKQDATGSRTVTWFSGITWAGGVAPTLTTTPNKRDWFGFRRTGSGAYEGVVVGANL